MAPHAPNITASTAGARSANSEEFVAVLARAYTLSEIFPLHHPTVRDAIRDVSGALAEFEGTVIDIARTGLTAHATSEPILDPHGHIREFARDLSLAGVTQLGLPDGMELEHAEHFMTALRVVTEDPTIALDDFLSRDGGSIIELGFHGGERSSVGSALDEPFADQQPAPATDGFDASSGAGADVDAPAPLELLSSSDQPIDLPVTEYTVEQEIDDDLRVQPIGAFLEEAPALNDSEEPPGDQPVEPSALPAGSATPVVENEEPATPDWHDEVRARLLMQSSVTAEPEHEVETVEPMSATPSPLPMIDVPPLDVPEVDESDSSLDFDRDEDESAVDVESTQAALTPEEDEGLITDATVLEDTFDESELPLSPMTSAAAAEDHARQWGSDLVDALDVEWEEAQVAEAARASEDTEALPVEPVLDEIEESDGAAATVDERETQATQTLVAPEATADDVAPVLPTQSGDSPATAVPPDTHLAAPEAPSPAVALAAPIVEQVEAFQTAIRDGGSPEGAAEDGSVLWEPAVADNLSTLWDPEAAMWVGDAAEVTEAQDVGEAEGDAFEADDEEERFPPIEDLAPDGPSLLDAQEAVFDEPTDAFEEVAATSAPTVTDAEPAAEASPESDDLVDAAELANVAVGPDSVLDSDRDLAADRELAAEAELVAALEMSSEPNENPEAIPTDDIDPVEDIDPEVAALESALEAEAEIDAAELPELPFINVPEPAPAPRLHADEESEEPTVSEPTAAELFPKFAEAFTTAQAVERPALNRQLLDIAVDLRQSGDFETLAQGIEVLVRNAVPGDDGAVELARTMAEPEVVESLCGHLADVRDPDRRDELVYVFGQLSGLMAPALASELSEVPPRAARRNYMDALFRMGSDAVAVAVPMLDDSRWFIVRNGVDILGEAGDEGSVARLAPSLAHPDQRVRRATVMALAKLGGVRAGNELLPVLEDPSAEVREGAAMALGHLRVAKALRPLLELLDRDKEDDTQMVILRSLGQIGDPGAVPAIEKRAVGFLFLKPNKAVRIAAYRALAGIGTPHASKLVREAVSDRDAEVAAAAQALVGQLHEEPEPVA